MELMVVTAIIGILAAVAIPIFSRMQAKANQAEARVNLGGITVAETSFFAEESRYGSFSEIGFTIEGVSKRYTYRSPAVGGAAGSTGTINVDLLVSGGGVVAPENTVVASGATLSGAGSSAVFTATATGNIDRDVTIDQWHIDQNKQGLDTPDVNDQLL